MIILASEGSETLTVAGRVTVVDDGSVAILLVALMVSYDLDRMKQVRSTLCVYGSLSSSQVCHVLASDRC